jgi:peptidoglycan/LPS O-acetylase OafA/YrhL
LFFVVATVLTIPLAAASWFLVEKRAIELKRRIQQGRPRAGDRAIETQRSRPGFGAGEDGGAHLYRPEDRVG